jgi:exodeoxyribonuclease VII large subunit
MAVVAHGRISIYEVSGALQFYVDIVQPEGMGILHLEFERLKVRLAEEGLFEPARKRALPPFPKRIGVVTSPDSAVLHDIINIIGRRYPLVELILAPTPVQGDAATAGIVHAFQILNDTEGIDLVILARGGGSLEELWAFNEEDFTIADFVADKRAPTPSAAAELAVPHREDLEARIQSCSVALVTALSREFDRSRQRIDEYTRAITLSIGNFLTISREKLRGRELTLSSLSPLATLGRGYALVQHSATGDVIYTIDHIHRGDAIEVTVSDGQFSSKVTASKKGLQAWMNSFPSKTR